MKIPFIKQPIAANDELIYSILAVTFSLLVAFLHYAWNPNFYFTGDVQIQYLPAFLEIAELVKSGELPWITLDSWAAGNLAGEYQYGIFNPASLIIFLAVAPLGNLVAISVSIVLIHTFVNSLGVYCLARALNISPRYAAIAALAIATNNYLLYWYATTWLPGILSYAWVPWALCFTYKSRENAKFIPAAAFFIFLVIASGYPYTVIALGSFVVLISVLSFLDDRSYRGVASVLLSGLAGCLLAAPALFPAFAAYSASIRTVEPTLLDNFLSSTLSGLVSFGFPSYQSVTQFFGGGERQFGVVELPIYYAGWFTIVSFSLFKWNTLRDRSKRVLFGLLVVAACFFILSMMPNVSPFKWSFKFIPFFHLPLVLASCWILSHRDALDFSANRQKLMAGIFFVLLILSLQLSPSYWMTHLMFFVLVVGFSQLSATLVMSERQSAPVVLLFATVVIAILTSLVWRSNSVGRPDIVFPVPQSIAEYENFRPGDAKENILSLVSVPELFRNDEAAIPPGNLGMLSPHRFVNGFSAFVSPTYGKSLCLLHVGFDDSCQRVWSKLFERDHLTDMDLADLMRLNRIIVENGESLRKFKEASGSNWVVGRSDASVTDFIRKPKPDDLPGYITWLPPDVSAQEGRVSIREETHILTIGDHHSGGPIIFQRAWYPGYRAYLNGVKIETFGYNGMLVAARLPAKSPTNATLTLRYELPGFPLAIVLFGLGLILCIFSPIVLIRAARSPGPKTTDC